MSDAAGWRAEIERIARVSDLLCTAHAGLRDKYALWALWLDLGLLGASTWLAALSFVDPELAPKLTPFDFLPQIWIGLLGVFAFFMALFQLRTDWKARSDAHRRSFDIYSEVKREGRYALAADVNEETFKRVIARYDLASSVSVEVPETAFLLQKQRHKKKIILSKALDDHAFTSLLLLRFRLWWRDNRRP